MKKSIVSPISIDFGAKHTGVYLTQFDVQECPLTARKEGALIVVPEEKMITLSQMTRRSKRHQLRGYKRRKLAKRLVHIILKEKWGLDVNKLEIPRKEFIHGLLNRRGYTYLNCENVDEATLDSAPLEWFLALFPGFFNEDIPLSIQTDMLSTNIDKARELSEHKNYSINGKFSYVFKDLLPDDKALQKAIESSYKELKKAVDELLKSKQDGHYYRAEYLDHIYEDIQNNTALCGMLKEHGITLDHFYRLIGHISNLQLRVLRKYFNDENMKKADYWNEKRMFRFFYRYVRSWHISPQNSIERKKRTELLHFLERKENKGNIINTWFAFDPKDTMPPYEDQLNRRPPKCLSLLIDKTKLDARFSNWRAISDCLREYAEDSDNIPQDKLLQRVLDLSAETTSFHIRNLCGDQPASENRQKLLDCLHGNATWLNELIFIAEQYYDECRMSARGDWHEELPGGILSRCDAHPPKKEKIKHIHLSTLLGCRLTEDNIANFETFFNETKYKGNKKIKTIAEACAEAQKKHGFLLNKLVDLLQAQEAQNKTIDSDLKDLQKLLHDLQTASSHLETYCNKNYDAVIDDGAYNNIYIFAQMHNVLDSEKQHGFSKTCRHCSLDNAWRSHMTLNEKGKPRALAKRLPADSVRPFDGMVARIVDKVARSIADRKYEQLKSLPSDTQVYIPVVLEENRFEFTAELKEIKRSIHPVKKKDIEDIEGRAKNEQEMWIDKIDRIKADSQNTCPYTGNPIGTNGQIDHIIPRSLSRKLKSAVYNVEPNLIYCSTTGNTDKGAKVYSLYDIHNNYFMATLGITDIDTIRSMIEQRSNELLADEKVITNFYGLSSKDRNIIRLALFNQSTRDDVLDKLNKQRTAKVNGTQQWLGKRIAYFIRKKLQSENNLIVPKIETFLSTSEDVSKKRVLLAEKFPLYKKSFPQSAISHVVDACMAFTDFFEKHGFDLFESQIACEQPDALRLMLPDAIDIITVQRKEKYRKTTPRSQPLFSDSIYGMRFVKIIVTSNEEIRLGFNRRNSILLQKEQKRFFELLQFYYYEELARKVSLEELKKKAQQQQQDVVINIHKSKAFALLHKVAKSTDCSKEEIEIASVLDGMFYFVIKKECAQHIFEQKENKKDLLSDKIFSFSLSLPKAFQCSGKLKLPSQFVWKQLLAYLNWDAKEEKITNEKRVELENQIRTFFLHGKQNNVKRHAKVRKVFSLPIIPTLNGVPFRIHRKSRFAQSPWQMLTASSVFQGFEVGRKLEKPRIDKVYAQSNNLHEIGQRQFFPARHICFMDEWLQIDVPQGVEDKIEALYIKPGSKNRRYSKLVMNFNSLSDYVLPHMKDATGITDGLQIPPQLKIADASAFQKAFSNTIGAPRTFVNFSRIGLHVTFEFENNSCPSTLSEQYAQKWHEKHSRA